MIGIFDSGFGGLTIFKEILNKLPSHNYIYLGDNARAPYGDKTQEEIYNYACEAVDFLFKKNCKLIIMACNSISAEALRKTQQEYLPKNFSNRNVIGVIRPVVEKITENNFKKIGIIGTRATIDSHIYQIELNKLDKKIKIIEKATPGLASIIEKGEMNNEKVYTILENYLNVFKEEKVEALILGCTHYPVFKNKINKIMGDDCLIYSPEKIVTDSLVDYLKRHKEFKFSQKKEDPRFFTTGNVDKFKEIGEIILSKKIKNITKTVL